MAPVAHIYANDDGTFNIASNLPALETVQLLLSLASNVAASNLVTKPAPEVVVTDAAESQAP